MAIESRVTLNLLTCLMLFLFNFGSFFFRSEVESNIYFFGETLIIKNIFF